VVVAIFFVRALLRSADADEHGGYRRKETVQRFLTAILNPRAVLVRPPRGEHPLDPPLHEGRHRPPVHGEDERESVSLLDPSMHLFDPGRDGTTPKMGVILRGEPRIELL